MRLVLDTVIVVRSLIKSYSLSAQILFDHWDAYEWIVSPDIVAEYQEVTTRPAITRKYVRLPNRDHAAFLARLRTAVTVYPGSVPAVCRDPGDDKFLAAALAGGADYIVSEDLDLLSLEVYEGIEICDTRTMMGLLGDAAAR